MEVIIPSKFYNIYIYIYNTWQNNYDGITFPYN